MSIFHGTICSAVGLSIGDSVGDSVGSAVSSAVSWAVSDGHDEWLDSMLGITRRFGWSNEQGEERRSIYHLYFSRSGDRILDG